MLKRIKIKYKGLIILVTGDYIRGRGYINYNDPPEEDEFFADDFDITTYNTIEQLKEFILSESHLNLLEIEKLCLEECINN